MPMPARAQRLARGWIVGLVATTVAAVSHSLAGGYRPGALSLGVALIFAGMLGTLVIGRRPSLPRLAVAVGVSQLAFHLLFSLLGSGSTGSASGFGMSGMAGMDTAVSPAVVVSGHDHLADPGMWIAHAIAAALTVLFLRRAELAVWTMLVRVIERVVLVCAPPIAALPPQAHPELPQVTRLSSRAVTSSTWRRGPPLLSF